MKRVFTLVYFCIASMTSMHAQECNICGDWQGVTNGAISGLSWTIRYYVRCRKYDDSYSVQIKTHQIKYNLEEEREYDDGVHYWDNIEITQCSDNTIYLFEKGSLHKEHDNGRFVGYFSIDNYYKLVLVNSGTLKLIRTKTIMNDYHINKVLYKSREQLESQFSLTLHKDNDDW